VTNVFPVISTLARAILLGLRAARAGEARGVG
jgi:hypothetical protein